MHQLKSCVKHGVHFSFASVNARLVTSKRDIWKTSEIATTKVNAQPQIQQVCSVKKVYVISYG